MGHSCFFTLLLLSSLMVHSMSPVLGRKVMETVRFDDSPTQFQESGGKSRVMIEVMDYAEPEPNTNPKSGFLFSPPPPPQG